MEETQITIIFGDNGAGSLRVVENGKELPNVTSVAVSTTTSGEIPEVTIKRLVPRLTVIDKTPENVEDMTEEKLGRKSTSKSKGSK